MRKLSAIALAGILVMTLAGPALAKAGGNAGLGPNGKNAIPITVADGVFGGTTTALASPGSWVKADCYQGGSLVYEDYELADSAGVAVLPLGPTMMWTGGSATCVAQAGTINNGNFKAAASTSFSVSG